jgi:hypothetical protein
MDDSDRNIMRSLMHEACEHHCVECGTCIPGLAVAENEQGEPVCDDCV